jgi:hypothetical protein
LIPAKTFEVQFWSVLLVKTSLKAKAKDNKAGASEKQLKDI